MSVKLTAEQETKLQRWIKDGFTIGTNTTPLDKDKAKAGIINILKECNLYTNQEFMFFPSVNAVKQFLIENNACNDLFNHMTSHTDIYWLAYYLGCEDMFNDPDKKPYVKFDDETKRKLIMLFNLAKITDWWWPFTKAVLVSDRPREIHFETDHPKDEAPRLHRLGGPAVSYSDGFSLYAIRGVRVTKEIAEGNFNSKDIVKEENQEVKRCMLDMYTPARFIQDINAKVVNEDRFGTLYSAETGSAEPLFMVRVTDATPQADGTFKEYWLQVDPKAYGGLTTAHAAVASTWRHKDGSMVFTTPEDYNPLIET